MIEYNMIFATSNMIKIWYDVTRMNAWSYVAHMIALSTSAPRMFVRENLDLITDSSAYINQNFSDNTFDGRLLRLIFFEVRTRQTNIIQNFLDKYTCWRDPQTHINLSTNSSNQHKYEYELVALTFIQVRTRGTHIRVAPLTSSTCHTF